MPHDPPGGIVVEGHKSVQCVHCVFETICVAAVLEDIESDCPSTFGKEAVEVGLAVHSMLESVGKALERCVGRDIDAEYALKAVACGGVSLSGFSGGHIVVAG